VSERSNHIPFPRIRFSRAEHQQYRNDRHQELSLDQANPDHGVLPHETKWSGSRHPAEKPHPKMLVSCNVR